MQELKWSMAAAGFSVKEVTHVLITHYHIDHGAIAQEIKDKGAKLIVMESQLRHLNAQKKFVKAPLVFHEIKNEGNMELAFKESRVFLSTLGIDGEIIATPGHSQDHVTLILDEGIAFTGDLPPENCSKEGSEVFKDWQQLRAMKVTRIYPAHGLYDLAI
jgi:glyoxylase-like metal-dependent hydrolase (beta-lactamase superfamily II)